MLAVSLQSLLDLILAQAGEELSQGEFVISHNEVYLFIFFPLTIMILSREKALCDSEFIHTLDRGVYNRG